MPDLLERDRRKASVVEGLTGGRAGVKKFDPRVLQIRLRLLQQGELWLGLGSDLMFSAVSAATDSPFDSVFEVSISGIECGYGFYAPDQNPESPCQESAKKLLVPRMSTASEFREAPVSRGRWRWRGHSRRDRLSRGIRGIGSRGLHDSSFLMQRES